MSLNILYCGNFKPYFSTENHIRLTLEDMGHRVAQCQEDEVSAPEILDLCKAVNADLVLYTRTWEIKGGRGLWLWDRLRSIGIPTASYHLDLYNGLKRGEDLDKDPFWKTQYVFSADGGSDAFFQKFGINHYWLRAGVYKNECYLAEPDKAKYPHDIIFVGSYEYHPEWPYRPKLIDWLRSTYGNRFGWYGQPGKPVRGNDLNTLYASAKIAIGDSLVLNFDHKNYWSDRAYEAQGRGAFQIFPRIQGLESEFTDGANGVFYEFNNFDQLQETIGYYLDNPGHRETIRLAGHEFVKEHCTYHNRMEEMLGTLAAKEINIAKKLWGQDLVPLTYLTAAALKYSQGPSKETQDELRQAALFYAKETNGNTGINS